MVERSELTARGERSVLQLLFGQVMAESPYFNESLPIMIQPDVLQIQLLARLDDFGSDNCRQIVSAPGQILPLRQPADTPLF